MRTAKATRERLTAQLRTIGFVSAEESSVAIVTARFSGWIDDVSVAQAGERIEKGHIVATVSGPELLTAQQVYLAAREWDSRQRQSIGGVKVAGVEEDNALRRLGFAERDVAAVGRRGRPLKSLPIRSPVSGYVAKKNILPGLYVQPGSELLRIVDLSKVWVVAEVPQKDAGRLQVGQRAQFSIAAGPGGVFIGKIDLVYPAMDPDTRTLRARMELTNAGLALRPGMYGEVLIDVPASESITVPSDAVVDTGELQYVFVDRANGRFEPRTVRVGASSGGRVQVLEGLAEGDQVVTTANFLVDSESRLRAAVEAFGAAPRGDESTGEHAAKGVHVQAARSP
jgi:Cu(I)/Ag(I) efflux system membrane fusion protein